MPKRIILISLVALLLSGCGETDEWTGGAAEGRAITLSADRVASRGYVPLWMCDNFKVFTVEDKGSETFEVMKGYEVRYEIEGWTYVSATQPLMYWADDADSYRFTAGAPINAVKDISISSLTLKLETGASQSAMAALPLKINRADAAFGHTVNLKFGYAHCRVGVAFINETDADIAVSDICLTPSANITTKGELTLTYDWEAGTTTSHLVATEWGSAPLLFDGVTVAAATAIGEPSATRHFVVPDGDNPTTWTISLKCDGVERASSFVNTTPWQPGKNITYVFKVGQKAVKLVDVVSADLDYFDCNDTESGGNFVVDDMTD